MSINIKQGDIIYVDFEPAKGSEIKKRRPVVVVSRDEYSRGTNLMIVCPITSTIKKAPYLVSIKQSFLKEGSKINTKHVYILDSTESGGRNVQILG